MAIYRYRAHSRLDSVQRARGYTCTATRRLPLPTVNTRRQLSMYVPAAEGARLESLRQELDPVQAALIPAHVTLCREDELVQWFDSEVEARLQASAAKPLTLSFGPPVIFQGHGILLPCVAGEREFHEVRSQVLATSTIRRHAPHITLAHPRNPPSANRSIANAMRLPYPLSYTFVTIASIEQVGDAPWRVLRVFTLAPLPVGWAPYGGGMEI